MDRRNFIKTTAAGMAIANIPGTVWANLSGLSNEAIEEKVKSILSQMTIKEKVEQMSGWLIKDVLNAISPTGQRYTGYTPPNKRLGIPALQCLDGPRGVGLFYKATCFPTAAARGASWDPKLEERVSEAMGYETAAFEGNMLLAPCINIIRHPSWGRSQESYGEDPHHMSVIGVASVKGIQKHAMACPKHYAVNNIDSSRFYVNAKVEERTLREIYLPHFKKCVEAGTASIMSAYNDMNGKLCGHNEHLLRDILKGEWKFDGLVISDWMQGVEDTVEAPIAGLDIEMPRPEFFGRKLVKAVKDKKVSEQVINEAVTRIVRQKLRFDTDYGKYNQDKIAGAEHAEIARDAIRKSVVLLKNDNDVLPIDVNKVKSIAVIGPFSGEGVIGDKGSSRVTPPYIVTPLEGLQKRTGGSVELIQDDGKNLDKAKKAAASADCVLVFVGLTSKEENEGRDRVDLRLARDQENLIKEVCSVNSNCAVILIGGSAITMESWKDSAPAIMMAWYPGMEGGHGLADVLLGDFNPCAKLPVAWPKSADQLFLFDNVSEEVEIGYYHGYRYFDKNNIEPDFPFGFGLSYTTYNYKNLRLDKKQSVKPGL